MKNQFINSCPNSTASDIGMSITICSDLIQRPSDELDSRHPESSTVNWNSRLYRVPSKGQDDSDTSSEGITPETILRTFLQHSKSPVGRPPKTSNRTSKLQIPTARNIFWAFYEVFFLSTLKRSMFIVLKMFFSPFLFIQTCELILTRCCLSIIHCSTDEPVNSYSLFLHVELVKSCIFASRARRKRIRVSASPEKRWWKGMESATLIPITSQDVGTGKHVRTQA